MFISFPSQLSVAASCDCDAGSHICTHSAQPSLPPLALFRSLFCSLSRSCSRSLARSLSMVCTHTHLHTHTALCVPTNAET